MLIDCREVIEDTIRNFNRNMLEDCKWSFLSNSCPSYEAMTKIKWPSRAIKAQVHKYQARQPVQLVIQEICSCPFDLVLVINRIQIKIGSSRSNLGPLRPGASWIRTSVGMCIFVTKNVRPATLLQFVDKCKHKS